MFYVGTRSYKPGNVSGMQGKPTPGSITVTASIKLAYLFVNRAAVEGIARGQDGYHFMALNGHSNTSTLTCPLRSHAWTGRRTGHNHEYVKTQAQVKV